MAESMPRAKESGRGVACYWTSCRCHRKRSGTYTEMHCNEKRDLQGRNAKTIRLKHLPLKVPSRDYNLHPSLPSSKSPLFISTRFGSPLTMLGSRQFNGHDAALGAKMAASSAVSARLHAPL